MKAAQVNRGAASPLAVTLTLSADAQERLVELLLNAAEQVSPQAPQAPALLDRSGLARALGASVATIDRLVRQGAPFVWLVDSKRFELEMVLQWLRGRREERSDERK